MSHRMVVAVPAESEPGHSMASPDVTLKSSL
jgi:hypothetical protein